MDVTPEPRCSAVSDLLFEKAPSSMVVTLSGRVVEARLVQLKASSPIEVSLARSGRKFTSFSELAPMNAPSGRAVMPPRSTLVSFVV